MIGVTGPFADLPRNDRQEICQDADHAPGTTQVVTITTAGRATDAGHSRHTGWGGP